MKVNLSKSINKKSLFPFEIDSSGSANFGECLPFIMHMLVPQSTATIDVSNAVRFSPLSFPTFGKAYLKTYLYNHKISDLYPPFNALISQTPYVNSNGGSYVPSQVPSLPLYILWLSVVLNCEFTLYNCSATTSAINNSSFKQNSFEYEKVNKVVYNDGIGPGGSSIFINIDDKYISKSLIYWILQSLIDGVSPLGQKGISSAFKYFDYLTNGSSKDQLVYSNGSTSSIYLNKSLEDNTIDEYVSIDSADFLVPIIKSPSYLLDTNVKNKSVSFISNTSNFGNCVIAAVRLNNSGKFLRKILMGLGYQITPQLSSVNILPIYAYFKSYFNTFAPKRFVNFEQTTFAQLINVCVNTGVSIADLITTFNGTYSNNICLSNVIDDLLSCYYTKNTDYYSAQIAELINDYGNSLSLNYLGVNNDGDGQLFTLSNGPDSGVIPSLKFSEENYAHTQNQQNILSRLTQFVNRRSASGSKIAGLLSSVFGISPKEVENETSYIGSNSIDVNFNDVFSTAETEQASLGEYAGKALGFGKSDSYTVNSDTHSIIVGFYCVIPRTQYVQGVNPLLFNRTEHDFYNPMFDGLTLVPTKKLGFYASSEFSAGLGSGVFGNLPIYSEYKTKTQGVLTGDLSLRSTKSTYDSFTLDQIITSYERIEPDSDFDYNGSYIMQQLDYNDVVSGTMWRYLGRWIWLGKFDRIFVNNRLNYNSFIESIRSDGQYDDTTLTSGRQLFRTDDNLIVHNVINIKVNAPMIPLKGSWMTEDMNNLDSNGIVIQGE